MPPALHFFEAILSADTVSLSRFVTNYLIGSLPITGTLQ
jgi:hypothetical protein